MKSAATVRLEQNILVFAGNQKGPFWFKKLLIDPVRARTYDCGALGTNQLTILKDNFFYDSKDLGHSSK